MNNILVVDDELSIRESFSLILEGKYKVLTAASGEAALKIAADQKLDLIFLDIRMPGMDGLETLKRIKQLDASPEIIMVTAVNDAQKASQAVKLGARDYIVKPFDVPSIQKMTEQLLRKRSIVSESGEIRKKAGNIPYELIGQSEKIAAVNKIIDKIKKKERVLIAGEAGTEKETVARIIHEKSDRAGHPFLIARLSREMSSSEIKKLLFGREKGNSTADLETQSGLLEQAKDGTLFIDNLEALPEEVLQSLASLKFSRIGSGSASQEIEARLIGGAPADLADKNKAVFDFFAEAYVPLPSLRERSSDIPIMVSRFLESYNSRHGKEVKIAPHALEALANYSWPGNADELENLIERLVLCCPNDPVAPKDLPLDLLLKTAAAAGGELVSAFEKKYVQILYDKSGKNKEKAAVLLGINPILLETRL